MKMGLFDFLLPKKRAEHELKWKLPEARLVFVVKDAEKAVYDLKKNKAVFVSGGEFFDVVHAKQYGQDTFAYFIVRTEKKTGKEFLSFDGYMLQEEDKLGFEVQSSYSMIEQLDKLGYKEVLARELQEWDFNFGVLRVKALDIKDLGALVEFALPETKFERAREAQEKTLDILLAKMNLKKEEGMPTDAITLQMLSSQKS